MFAEQADTAAGFLFFLLVFLVLGGIIGGSSEEPAKQEEKRQKPLDPALVAWLGRNGWEYAGDGKFRGLLKTGYGSWHGCAAQTADGYRVWIKDPPGWLFKGTHRTCLIEDQNGWWKLHFDHAPRGVVEAVRGMEKFIMRQAQRSAR